MSLRCANCNNDVNNVGEVRQCGTCQRNGTAGGVHSKFQNHDSVEALVADANPGAFPFAPVEEQVPEPTEVIETINSYTEEQITAAAMAAHEANRAYCASIGDDSQKPWDDSPERQQASAIAGVRYLIDNPDSPETAQHDAWSKAKETDGWVFGETKDAEKKTHPCLVPFDQLPPEQQEKDRIFQRTVRETLAA